MGISKSMLVKFVYLFDIAVHQRIVIGPYSRFRGPYPNIYIP